MLALKRHALPAIAAVALLAACAMQTYAPAPIVPAQQADQFRARSLDSAELRAYLRTQGYPAQTWPIKQWGLHELTLAAFFFHPRLELARARAGQAEAAGVTAARRPNPGIALGSEHHSDTAGGVSPWTLGFTLEIPLETAGKRDIRMQRAAALGDAARFDLGQIAWEVRSRLRSALLDYAAAEQTLALLQKESEQQQQIVAMLEKRLALGMVSDIDLANARLQQQKTAQLLDGERGRLPQLRAAIAAACGLPAAALEAVQLDTRQVTTLPAPELLPPAEVQQAALLNRLDIRAALARYAAAESALKLEIAKQYPDLTLAPGYTYDQGDRLWTLGFSLLLGLLDRNEGPIAEAEAQRAAEAAQFELLQTRVIGEQEQARSAYLAAYQQMNRALQLLAAQGTRQQRLQRQVDAGYSDRLELAGAGLEALQEERGLQQAAYRAQLALGRLEDAVQRPLVDAPPLALPQR